MRGLFRRTQESERRIQNIILKTALCFFLILTSGFCILNSAFAGPPSPFAIEKLVGQPAPDFTTKDINGNQVSLSSFRGKVVLLKFWATWCPPCRAEIPSINKLAGLLSSRGLVILAVSADTSASAVKDFMKKNPVGFTVLIDNEQKITKNLYKAFMVPTAFLIDRRGVVVNKYFGEHDWTGREVLKDIESYL